MRDAQIAPLVLKAPHCLLEHDWKDRLSRDVILPALNLPLLPSIELIVLVMLMQLIHQVTKFVALAARNSQCTNASELHQVQQMLASLSSIVFLYFTRSIYFRDIKLELEQTQARSRRPE